MTAQTATFTDTATTEPGWKTRLGQFFVVLSRASRYARAAEYAQQLNAMSDAQLAARGLTRDRVVQHAFGGLFYV